MGNSGRSWAREYTSGQATGKDFTASDVDGLPAALPNWFELPNGGTLVAVDGDGTAVTFSSLFAGSRYNTTLRSITTCSGTIRLGYSANPQPSAPSAGAPGPNWNVTGVKTAAYTAVLGDFVPVNTVGGAVTITLPTAVGGAGQRIQIKDTGSAGTNAITVAVTSAQTVDGTTPATIAVAKASRIFVSDGANWYVG